MANSKTVRVLIVVFVGVLAFAAIYPRLMSLTGGRSLPSPLPPPTEIPFVFGGISPTDITRISVEARATGHRVTLAKGISEWSATDQDGKALDVSPNQISKMITILPSLRYNRSMNESNLKDFGLADGGEFIVQFDAGRSHTLRVGAISADGSLSYVQRDAESAVLWVPVQPVAGLLALVSAPESTPPVSGTMVPTRAASDAATKVAAHNSLFHSPP